MKEEEEGVLEKKVNIKSGDMTTGICLNRKPCLRRSCADSKLYMLFAVRHLHCPKLPILCVNEISQHKISQVRQENTRGTKNEK